MSVYKKLAAARAALQKKDIKKTGHVNINFKSGVGKKFDYFDLVDFIPFINEIFNTIGLCSQSSFSENIATLAIFDVDDPNSKAEFSIPLKFTINDSKDPMQQIGSIVTYARRYLWYVAMEIVESDSLEQQNAAPAKPYVSPEVKNAYTKINTASTIDGLNKVFKEINDMNLSDTSWKRKLQDRATALMARFDTNSNKFVPLQSS